MSGIKTNSKQIDMIFGSQYQRPSQAKINESARWARENGIIPRGCHITCDQVYGGWAIHAEYIGSNEKTRSKYFDR